MKAAVLDFRFSDGHVKLNTNYILAMSRFCEMVVMNDGSYYNHIRNHSNIKLRDIEVPAKKKVNPLTFRLECIKRMKGNIRQLKQEENVDCIIIFTYEIITFALWPLLYRTNKPVYIFEHNSLDELTGVIKNICYNSYKNKVGHIVLEDIFTDFLIREKKVRKENVKVVHYCLDQVYENRPHKGRLKNIVCISRCGDDQWIEDIIKEEESNKLFCNNKIKLLLRSGTINYTDGYLTVIKHYLTDDEYNNYVREADAILMLGSHFKNRISCSIYDAITYGKVIIGIDIPIIRYLEDMTPTVVRHFSDMQDMVSIFLNEEFDVSEEEIHMLQSKYTSGMIVEDWKKVLIG